MIPGGVLEVAYREIFLGVQFLFMVDLSGFVGGGAAPGGNPREEVSKVLASGESQIEVIRPDVNRDMMIACQAQITSEAGFLLLREICACRLGLFLGASLPGGAGLGVHRRQINEAPVY